MTYEEAMEMLTRLKDYEFVYREDAMEAHRMACEALEKQMPKKPVVKKGNFYIVDLKSGERKAFVLNYCPCCNVFLESTKEHHCQCGQALDWSDEK